MTKEVFLDIKSEVFQNGEEDTIEFSTEGELYKKNNKTYISYKETEISGMEGTTTILIIDKGKLTINRYGTNKSKMVFMLGETTFSKYKTPYGIFKMEVMTKKLNINLEKKYIEVNYNLVIKGLSDGTNKLYIKIK